MKFFILFVSSFLCLILLAGCGQAGKLYLPKQQTHSYDANNTDGRLS